MTEVFNGKLPDCVRPAISDDDADLQDAITTGGFVAEGLGSETIVAYNDHLKKGGTLLLLVRHGETENPFPIISTRPEADLVEPAPYNGPIVYGQRPHPLTFKGELQARSTAVFLKRLIERLEVASDPLIVTSWVYRAMETACLISMEIGVPGAVLILEGLEETDYPHTGQVLRYKVPGKEGVVQHFNLDEVGRYPSNAIEIGGETPNRMANRMVETLHSIVESNPARVVIAVSHADPLSFAIQRLNGIDAVEPVPTKDFPPYASVHVGLATIGDPNKHQLKILGNISRSYVPNLNEIIR